MYFGDKRFIKRFKLKCRSIRKLGPYKIIVKYDEWIKESIIPELRNNPVHILESFLADAMTEDSIFFNNS